ncbi:MAG: aspartate ammonia-lyase, partial [Armatimonadetes bacterium]|nr:aspartate ammonia-lyase [Armatimonadota bacterium]
PIIADALLGSLDLLRRACDIFYRLCVKGIEPNEARTRQQVASATATVTALVERIGYHQAQEVATRASEEGKPVREVVVEMGLLTVEEFDELTSPEAVTRLGSPEVEGLADL